jgi:hypothetical protein
LNLLGLSKEGIIPWDGDHFLLLARESGDLPLMPSLIQPQHKEGSGCRESGRDAS